MGRRKKIEKELLESPDAHPDARGLRVKRVRNMANLSRQQMCEDTDININSLKGWEIGRYGGLTWYGAEKILKRVTKEGVQCSVDWLLYGAGAGPTVQLSDIPQEEDKKITEEIRLFKNHYDHAVDFIVVDDGMAPIYKPGDYVAGINLSGDKINNAIGLDCIVQMDDGTMLLRQLRKGLKSDIYSLVCINMHTVIDKPMLYDIKLVSAAPVIFQRKKNSIVV